MNSLGRTFLFFVLMMNAFIPVSAKMLEDTVAVVNGTPIYRVSELAGPARFPSPDHETDRWTFALAITFRGQPT